MTIECQHRECEVRTVLFLTLAFSLLVSRACGGGFRLSLLDQPESLGDTCRVLEDAGVSKQTVATFRALVNHHNQVASGVDDARLPKRRGGFYPFESTREFTNHLSRPLGRGIPDGTPEIRTLMCFDVASILLAGAGYGAPQLEQAFSGSGIVLPIPGGPVRDPQYRLFHDAYLLALCSEADFLRLTGRTRTQAETELALSLIAPRALDGTEAGHKSDINAALAALFRSMERFGFSCHGKLRLGLVLVADFKGHAIAADHAFVCLRHDGKWVCLEKTSPQGPYVRADFDTERDLARYEASTYVDFPLTEHQTGYGCPVAVTLGDRVVSIDDPAASSR